MRISLGIHFIAKPQNLVEQLICMIRQQRFIIRAVKFPKYLTCFCIPAKHDLLKLAVNKQVVPFT